MKKSLKYYLVDSTATISVINPIIAALEVGAAGMSNETSIHSRFLATALTYGGLGTLYAKGRDMSKRIFKITKDSSERAKTFHDTLYWLVYICLTQPPFYYATGSRSVKEIAIGTVSAAGLGLFTGSLLGYSIDTYRDFTGLEESERLPVFLKNQSPRTKKYIASLLTVASVGTLAAIYSLNK